jgi:hypothetical protein
MRLTEKLPLVRVSVVGAPGATVYPSDDLKG